MPELSDNNRSELGPNQLVLVGQDEIIGALDIVTRTGLSPDTEQTLREWMKRNSIPSQLPDVPHFSLTDEKAAIMKRALEVSAAVIEKDQRAPKPSRDTARHLLDLLLPQDRKAS